MTGSDVCRFGVLTASDRASAGDYDDLSGPAIERFLEAALTSPWEVLRRVVADEQDAIEAALVELLDTEGCSVVVTTGGTGPAPRDVTPEATESVCERMLPGFGEQMRQISLRFVPTAILSRQVAVIRDQSLIINLPGQPKSIAETLEGLKDAEGTQLVPGIFAAVPYCIDLIGGPMIETRPQRLAAFRPASAVVDLAASRARQEGT